MSAVYMMLSEAWLSPGGEWVQGQGPDPTSMLQQRLALGAKMQSSALQDLTSGMPTCMTSGA